MQLLLVISDISVNFQTGDSRLIASAQDKGKGCRLRAETGKVGDLDEYSFLLPGP